MIFIYYLYLLNLKLSLATNGSSIVLSSTQYDDNLSSNSLFDRFADNKNDVLVIASTYGDNSSSKLSLEAQTFSRLQLNHSVKINDHCPLLQDNMQNLFNRTHFSILNSVEEISLIKSGISLYRPVFTRETIDPCVRLVSSLRNNKNVTFFVTDCQLFLPQTGVGLGSSRRGETIEKIVESLRATPVIVQQIIVLVLFVSILLFGLFCTLDVKTPSILLNPPQVHKKKL